MRSKNGRSARSPFLLPKPSRLRVDSEEWQLAEFQAGIAGLDSEREIGHEKVVKWLKSWGKPSETKTRDDDRMIPPGVAPLGIHSPTHRKGLRTERSSGRKPHSRGSRSSFCKAIRKSAGLAAWSERASLWRPKTPKSSHTGSVGSGWN